MVNARRRRRPRRIGFGGKHNRRAAFICFLASMSSNPLKTLESLDLKKAKENKKALKENKKALKESKGALNGS